MPSPSGVAFSFSRNSANSDTWNALIFAIFAIFSGIVAVMRQRVMRIGHADLGVGAVAGLARELERDDARDVALQRQHLQVEHQPRVVGVRGRHADRPVEIGQRIVRRRRLGLLDAPLDFADGLEILVDPGAIGRAELRSAGARCRRCTESSRLARLRSAARRSAALPPSPNRRSKTMRGCASAGSGVVGDDHERLF